MPTELSYGSEEIDTVPPSRMNQTHCSAKPCEANVQLIHRLYWYKKKNMDL